MKFDDVDIKELASAMREAGIRSFKFNNLAVELHESAFAPVVAGQPQDPKAFLDMPRDDQLQFYSSEGEPEKREDEP